MSASWNSFFIGTIVAVVFAIVVGIVLDKVNPTAGEAFSSSSTRL
jgi:hypothetical protein